jgi:hypothetical protein
VDELEAGRVARSDRSVSNGDWAPCPDEPASEFGPKDDEDEAGEIPPS